MRTIKFRAWDEGNKKMFTDVQFIKSGDDGNDWILFTSNEQPYKTSASGVIFDSPYCRPQIHLMQFTGLLDKNGKEIYFDDLVMPPSKNVFRVIWFEEEMRIALLHQDTIYNFNVPLYEVIGNIYENPDLLK